MVRRTAAVTAPEKTPLTPELCQTIVVSNTPDAKAFSGNPKELLAQLGVLDSDQTKAHRDAIVEDLKTNYNYRITAKLIKTGPGVSVKDCSASVENNAT